MKSCTRKAGLACLALLGALAAFVTGVERAEATALRCRALPLVLPAVRYNQPPAALSADGRWLAYFDDRKGRSVAVFYCLPTARSWVVDLGKYTQEWPGYGMDESLDLVWRPDKSVCAVLTQRGWALAAPDRKRIRRLPTDTEVAGTVSWSPNSGHLALFGLDGLFQLWDGHRLRQGPDWMQTLHVPEYAVERTWQSEWSPDGRQVFLRFYGHADRDSTSPGHMLLLRPNTSQPHYRLTEEAGPTHWLDAHRLVFMGDDYIGAGPAPLKVSRPQTETSHIWLKDVADWTLSRRRDTIWAVNSKGVLYRTPARRRRWRRVGKVAGSSLTVSSDGKWLAVSDAQFASGPGTLILFPINKRRARQNPMPALHSVVLLGWPAGQEFPLVARPWHKEQWRFWQVQRD